MLLLPRMLPLRDPLLRSVNPTRCASSTTTLSFSRNASTSTSIRTRGSTRVSSHRHLHHLARSLSLRQLVSQLSRVQAQVHSSHQSLSRLPLLINHHHNNPSLSLPHPPRNPHNHHKRNSLSLRRSRLSRSHLHRRSKSHPNHSLPKRSRLSLSLLSRSLLRRALQARSHRSHRRLLLPSHNPRPVPARILCLSQ